VKLLIIGGTRFVGRALVEDALAHGHEVTLFYRGKSNPDIFPDAEHLHGDRDSEMHKLDGRKWDACIDTCGYIPRHVRQAVGRLADAVEQYTFISTISVYADPVPAGSDEDAPLKTLEDEESEEVTGDTYGGLKVLCDRDILVPGDPNRPVQFIDTRDLGAWIVRMVEANNTGAYNAVGPAAPLTWGAWMDAIVRITGSDARLTWVDDAFMVQHESDNLPFYIPETHNGIFALSQARAAADGLTHRPVDTVIADAAAWSHARPADAPRRAGIARERERELLTAWQTRS